MAGFGTGGPIGIGTNLHLQHVQARAELRAKQIIQNFLLLARRIVPQKAGHAVAGDAANALEYTAWAITVDVYRSRHRECLLFVFASSLYVAQKIYPSGYHPV